MANQKATQLCLAIEDSHVPSIKALTIWQPWASAIALGAKKFETRGWPTRYRGVIAIHASKRPLDKFAQALARQYGFVSPVLGAIVAVAELTDCIEMTPEFIAAQSQRERDFGDWQPGRYAWKLEKVVALQTPIPCRGAQGLWTFHGPLI